MSITDQTPVRLRKRIHRVLVEERLLLRLGRRTAQIAPFDDPRAQAVELLCGGTSRSQLVLTVGATHGDGAGATAGRMFDEIAAAGFLERLDLAHRIEPLDVARFDRLLNYLSQSESQEVSRFDTLERLRTAQVTVIGTGGLGSWIIYNLLCSGVGNLKLIDGDVVEYSNLNRSILYDERQVARPKVDAARESALRFAPRTHIETRRMVVTSPEVLLPEVAGQDLVIATADSPPWEVRQWVADACVQAGVPLLHPSGLHVGPLYVPGRSACPMCEWAYQVDRNPDQAEILLAQRRISPGDPGAVSHVGTITAGVVALEAFRFLTDTAEPATIDGVWEMDAELRAAVRALPAHPRCGVCGTRTADYRIAADTVG
jgi:bacteriocin biosynthesis cyclodehydratase domain-containing protein